MKRSIKITYSACIAVFFLAIGYVWVVPHPKSTSPSLSEALGMQVSGMPTRLYSGAVDAKTGKPAVAQDISWDIVTNDVRTGSFLTNKDQSTRDTFFQPDGEGKKYVSEFYPKDPLTGIRAAKGLIVYTSNGKSIQKEIWWRLDGTREKVGHLLNVKTGRYETITLAADGETMLTSDVTEPNPYANNFEPKLIVRKEWYANAKHSLKWLDALNDDGTRDMTAYDENEQPVMTKHQGRYPPAGTVVKYFFPGTTKVRMEGVVEAGVTLIKRYREDGTVLYMSKMDTSQTSTIYLDQQGKPLFEQSRWQSDDGGQKGWPLYKLVEIDASGNAMKREIFWTDGKVKTENLYRACVDGVLYDKVIRTYREDGTLEHVDMIGRKVEKRSVDYTVEDNIRIVIPPQELQPLEPHLLIPYPEAQSID